MRFVNYQRKSIDESVISTIIQEGHTGGPSTHQKHATSFEWLLFNMNAMLILHRALAIQIALRIKLNWRTSVGSAHRKKHALNHQTIVPNETVSRRSKWKQCNMNDDQSRHNL